VLDSEKATLLSRFATHYEKFLRKKKVFQVTLYGFEEPVSRAEAYAFEERISNAEAYIQSVLDPLKVDRQVTASELLVSSACMVFIMAFINSFRIFLKHNYNVELLIPAPGIVDADDGKDEHPPGHSVRRATLHLHGLRRDVRKSIDYLSNLQREFTERKIEINADTSFKFRELVNVHKSQHKEHPVPQVPNHLSRNPVDKTAPPLIYMKMAPPLHSNGISAMKFPQKVTFTFCAHNNHKTVMERLIETIREVDVGFTLDTVKFEGEDKEIVMRKMFDKQWRASFLQRTQISGVLWNQDTGTRPPLYQHDINIERMSSCS
jgi:hypothetical protein